jgi:type VI secretion system secreted protein Hcp
MSFDAYLKFSPEIYGESTDAGHEKWIELDSFSVGRTQPTSGARSRGAEAPTLSEIVVTKHVDIASPKLYQASATGKPFKSAVLELPAARMHWVMNEVVIAGVTRGATARDDALPTESVSLVFAHIEWSYGPAPSQSGRTRQAASGLAGMALSMLRRLAP